MQCEFSDKCFNFYTSGVNHCSGCKYSSEPGSKDNWLGYGEFINTKHPSLFKSGNLNKQVEASNRTKKAAKKEKQHLIKISKNSGRSNRDGDYTDDNTLYDHKYQDTIDIKIRMVDVDKAKADAIRNSKPEYILVIENINGRKFEVKEITN